jgi:DNA-binding CsgD family transcriptional regulator
MRVQVLFLFIIAMSLASSQVVSGQEIPQLIQYEPSTYQAANQNWDFAQDDKGYLYVANSDGVLIHNGMGWQLVELPRNVRPRAVHFHMDRVYVVGFETLGWIDISDRAQPVFVPLFEDDFAGRKEEFWGLASLGTTLLYQSFSQVFTLASGASPQPLRLASTFMLGSQSADKMGYYLPAINGPLLRLGSQEATVDTITPLPFIPDDARIISVVDDEAGALVFTQFKGVYRVLDDKMVAMPGPISQLLRSAQANKAIRLQDGRIAVGTIQSGVIILEGDLSIAYQIDRNRGLLNNTVLSLYQDRMGQLWIGLDNGIAVLALQDADRHYYDVAGDLGTVTSAVTYDGALFLGSNQGLFRQTANGGFELIDGSQGPVFNLAVIGEELICSHNLGCFVLSGSDFKRIDGIVGTRDVQLLSPSLMLATTYGGLQLCKRSDDGEWELARSIYTPVLLSDISVVNDTLLGYHDYTGVVLALLAEDSLKVLRQWMSIDDRPIGGGAVEERDGRLLYVEDEQFYLVEHDDLIPTTVDASHVGAEDIVIPRDYGYQHLLDTNQISVVPSIYLDYWLRLGDDAAQPIDSVAYTLPTGSHTLALHLASDQGIDGDVEYMLDGLVEEWLPLPSDGVIDRFTIGPGDYSLRIRDEVMQRVVWQVSVKAPWYKTAWLLLFVGLLLWTLFLLTRWYSASRLAKQRRKLEEKQGLALQDAAIKAKQQRLEAEVEHKARLLANSALTLAQKNKMLQELRNKILLSDRKDGEGIGRSQVIRLIDRTIDSDEGWRIFDQNFDEVHAAFLEQLRRQYADMTAGEVRLASFIRMGLSSKEIAPLLNISVRSVENKRYRLRKKMNIDANQNLSDIIRRL